MPSRARPVNPSALRSPEGRAPAGSFGQGLAIAAHAGAELSDLEFVQFHPTAFDGPARPMPLVSEAVRGEGAILVDEKGRRFLADEPGAELAPRDVVARAIWRQIHDGHRVFLDARPALGASFAKRFPVIAAYCLGAGVDPATQPIPVRPAEHYHMGGIAVDADGRSSIDGLWACGEAACNGLHGANRLASNSLTEAVVFAGAPAARRAGAGIARPSRRAADPCRRRRRHARRRRLGPSGRAAPAAGAWRGTGRRSRLRRHDDRRRRLAPQREPRRAFPDGFPRSRRRAGTRPPAARRRHRGRA